ncbi:nuclear transport factor 2 family protein [Nakamurella sp. YIM 132087]|uniref:Nuclear transport factor 2 family protein n=1 Tax=Nakamurella alba TaxID=2665158 RepID=A0A7K1FSQ8_9ACTN|nr:nuclear transport factor 2 family protein [Nakamurella alba]MTD17110.1 nuclear transport factor 2 family protein [Nakamurella alba]
MARTLEELDAIVADLQDRSAIRDVLMRYSRGVDRLDRDLLLSVYHPDAIDDHGVFIGTAEAFADWAIGMHTTTHVSHQHAIFNISIDLDGDVAHTESYYMFVGLNREGKPLTMGGGRYMDRFEKRDGRWAIAARVCLRDWAQLDAVPEHLDQSAMTAVKGLAPQVIEAMRTGPQPARDRSDPSYDRPLVVDPRRSTSG